jgi:hypothetical protein
MKRTVIRALLLVVCILSSWAPLFLFLTILNAFNPMQVGFITTFSVQNDSGQEIDVWPLGAPGPRFDPHVLPLFVTKIPALPDLSGGRFRIRPGGTTAVHYDWDDTNFTELLIRTGGGQYKLLPVDTDRQPGCCSPPRSDVYVVPRVEGLMDAPQSSLGAVEAWRSFGGQLIVLAFTLVCVASWRARDRLGRDPRTNPRAA